MKRTLRIASIVLLAATLLVAYAALVVGTGESLTSPRLDEAGRSYLTPAAVEALAMYSDRPPPAPVEPVRRPGRGLGLNRPAGQWGRPLGRRLMADAYDPSTREGRRENRLRRAEP